MRRVTSSRQLCVLFLCDVENATLLERPRGGSYVNHAFLLISGKNDGEISWADLKRTETGQDMTGVEFI